MKIFLVFWIIFIGCFHSIRTKAETLFLGVGPMLYDMGKYTTTSSGQANTMGTMYFLLSAGVRAPFFYPQLHISPIARKLGDDAGTTRVVHFMVPAAFSIAGLTDIKFGPGIFYYKMTGKSGPVTLGNGSSTAVYYKPATDASSSNISLNLGVGATLASSWRVDLDLSVLSVATARRAFSTTLVFAYGIF